jgi:hypothetical protein
MAGRRHAHAIGAAERLDGSGQKTEAEPLHSNQPQQSRPDRWSDEGQAAN